MRKHLQHDFLDLIERDLVAAPVIEFCRPRAFVPRHLLSVFKEAAVLEIDGNPGRKRIANIITAYRDHAAALVSPKFFLFADSAGLNRAEDFLDYPWLDGAGEQHRLLD
jgi:hypothetical protein